MSRDDYPPVVEYGGKSQSSAGIKHVAGALFCWHTWTKWHDVKYLQKQRSIDHAIIAEGIKQERRCQKCGKLQLRYESISVYDT